MKEVYYLIRKEIQGELKDKSSLQSLVLYLLSTNLVTYLAIEKMESNGTWLSIFWIILLFINLQAATRSFVGEREGRQIYITGLVRPTSLILSKIFHNIFLMLLLSICNFLVFSLFFGLPVKNTALFGLATFLGSMGFAGILTMMSAISSRTQAGVTIMSILSFPVLAPLIILLIKGSMLALMNQGLDQYWILMSWMLLINVITILLSYLLFPYLCRD